MLDSTLGRTKNTSLEDREMYVRDKRLDARLENFGLAIDCSSLTGGQGLVLPQMTYATDSSTTSHRTVTLFLISINSSPILPDEYS